MTALETRGESPFVSINRRVKELQTSRVDQLELGFTDLKEPVVVVEEPDTGPKGKKGPTPILSDFVQIPLQTIGFPYTPVGSPRRIPVYMDDQRRRHDREDDFTSRSPQQLSGVR